MNEIVDFIAKHKVVVIDVYKRQLQSVAITTPFPRLMFCMASVISVMFFSSELKV